MIASRAGRFAGVATVVAVLAGAFGIPLIRGAFEASGGWAIGGWLAASVIGIGAGAWMSHVHGRPGAGFLAALVAGMLVRLVVVGIGLVLALRTGEGPGWGFLSGFAIGFVPLQAYEVVWSMRAARARLSAADPVPRDGSGT